MRLKSLSLKGFKSFPDRTRLDFGPGVSVVVGPNGSGKSNVTDAVLWAMGEQSPLAVRGQSMQDVIFGGGRGVQARSSAEVEIVLDNSDGTVDLPLSEISIMRRLDRSGDGEYRLNGARARLVDIIEVLSDTGLGKENHSVISQGRVEAIVTSKPRDRRLLIEEAAGLGKHRKRRRRAQLKLAHTHENLDRALDVEREARSRLRPLKRQAEAAELHERLERQMLEVRLQLAQDTLRARRVKLGEAQADAQAARSVRAQVEAQLQAVIDRRGVAERALADRVEQRDALARVLYGARSTRERLHMRAEQANATSTMLTQRLARVDLELQTLSQNMADAGQGVQQSVTDERIASLESELIELDRRHQRAIEEEIEGLLQAHEQAGAQMVELERQVDGARAGRQLADGAADTAREQLASAEREVEDARRNAARVGAELAAVNQFLSSHTHPALSAGTQPAGGARSVRALSDALQVQAGYELALAAALGGRLDAALVGDMAGASELLDRTGPDGGMVLLAGEAASDESTTQGAARAPVAERQRVAGGLAEESLPIPGAQRLLDLVEGSQAVLRFAARLLSDAWVVERLDDLPGDFSGIAVTRTGRVWFAAVGEVRQVSEGGAERVLAQRNERERLIAESEIAVQAEHAARGRAEVLLGQLHAADTECDQANRALRDAERRQTEAREEQRRAEWLIEQRRNAPEHGPQAVRRAELEGELAAERRQAERAASELAEQVQRAERLRAQHAADQSLTPLAERLAVTLGALIESVDAHLIELEAKLASDRAAGDDMARELRACAGEEAELQARLRTQGEAVTAAEVVAQRLRDQTSDAEQELQAVAERLELAISEQTAQAEPLTEEQVQALETRLERLVRRREQLGPINPLAQEEYTEALAHVEELEAHRNDLETALRELRTVIRDTDRQIQETFQATFDAAAHNFEDLVGDVFPGGSGRLRLVNDEVSPHPVLGGQSPETQDGADAQASEDAAEAEAHQTDRPDGEEDLQGVEIEITPAGKSTKRLSLLSGGEKSMTALAFMFAVFLARPCPFYILDEVEAALDDLNLDRFLALLRRYAERAQFIVITHQKRTMEAADWLYGVSMSGDGVSKILSRRLPPVQAATLEPEVLSRK